MAIDIAFATGTGVTITNTETSLAVTGGGTFTPGSGLSTIGLYSLFLDGVTNMVKGDEYKIRIYEKARSGGNQRLIFVATISDVQSEMFITPAIPLGNAWDITLQRISATSRAFDWSVRRVS